MNINIYTTKADKISVVKIGGTVTNKAKFYSIRIGDLTVWSAGVDAESDEFINELIEKLTKAREESKEKGNESTE